MISVFGRQFHGTCTDFSADDNEDNTMLMMQKSLQYVAVMAIVVIAGVQCQENERRAVTEHQLMHDRGRSLQSLKRLIWLSSAIEGLHTAHTRTPLEDVSLECRGESPQPSLAHLDRETRALKAETLQTLWNVFYRPHLTSLSDGKK